MLKHQLMVYRRSLNKSPKLKPSDHFLFGLCALLINPARIIKNAIIIKPSTLLKFHKALIKKKYRDLYSSKPYRKPGPKGPSQELINAIIEMKQRNPRFGCPRIAEQIDYAFGLEINKDIVRRILNKYYKPTSNDCGPSWLTFLSHMKDSLWSIDLFRCESALLKSHWVLLVMDQFSRKIIAFSVKRGDIDGATLCWMCNKIVISKNTPDAISTDHDPLFRFNRWQANLRIMDIKEIKTIPYTPISHPFIERLIGTVRREYLDQTLFWTSCDLENKLKHFQEYYNNDRTHSSRDGKPPTQSTDLDESLLNFRWQKFCRGLFQLPCPA